MAKATTALQEAVIKSMVDNLSFMPVKDIDALAETMVDKQFVLIELASKGLEQALQARVAHLQKMQMTALACALFRVAGKRRHPPHPPLDPAWRDAAAARGQTAGRRAAA